MSNCINNNDSKKPIVICGARGPRGARGPIGPPGPAGVNIVRAAYMVTLPIDRMELDPTNLITLDTNEETIKFNTAGHYKIEFKISAYPSVNGVDFDPTTDIVSVGFRQLDTDNVYVGTGEWVFNGEAVELSATGIIVVTDTNALYELVNLGPSTIYLNTPSIKDIKSKSYFSNSLVTLVITYLGN